MWGWIGLGAALLLAGLLWRRLLGGYPAPQRAHLRLGRGEAAFVSAAAEAFYPPGGALGPSGGQADLPDYIDRLLDASHTRVRLLVHALFFWVEHSTLWWPAPGRGGRRRFSALDPEQRVGALESLARRRWFFPRLVFTSLRALVTLGYFAHPPVLRELRLAPLAIETPVCQADLWYPPIGLGPEAIRLGPEDLTAPSDGAPLDPSGPLDPRYAGEGR